MQRLVLVFGVAALAVGTWVVLSSVGTPPAPVVAVDEPTEGVESSALEGRGPGKPAEVSQTGLDRSEVAAPEAGAAPDPGLLRVFVTENHRQPERGDPLLDRVDLEPVPLTIVLHDVLPLLVPQQGLDKRLQGYTVDEALQIADESLERRGRQSPPVQILHQIHQPVAELPDDFVYHAHREAPFLAWLSCCGELVLANRERESRGISPGYFSALIRTHTPSFQQRPASRKLRAVSPPEEAT